MICRQESPESLAMDAIFVERKEQELAVISDVVLTPARPRERIVECIPTSGGGVAEKRWRYVQARVVGVTEDGRRQASGS
jgi:hypothetical protein